MKIPPARVVIPEEDRKQIFEQFNTVFDSGMLTCFKQGEAFEEAFAKYTGSPHAIAVNSGTSSLEILIRAHGLEGKEVICPANTFFATAAAIAHSGAKVKLCESDPETLCSSLAQIEAAITPNTAAVVIVHIGGIVAPDTKKIAEFCKNKNLCFLEDAAHGHGATLDGQQAGTFGDGGSFSFFPTKVMTAGEGGMITCKSEKVAEEAKKYRDQGKASASQNLHTHMGYNWRMSEIHAIIGMHQLNRLDEFIANRTRAAKIFDEKLAAATDKGVHAQVVPAGVKSNYYKYVVHIDEKIDRVALKQRCRSDFTVSLSGEVYELPLNSQPIFQNMLSCKEGDFPQAEKACKGHVCLPTFGNMSEEEAEYTVDSFIKCLG